MEQMTLELHADLARWLDKVAKERGIDVSQAALRLLDEARMQDLCVTEIKVPTATGQLWRAKMAWRGLTYTGYPVTWTPLSN